MLFSESTKFENFLEFSKIKIFEFSTLEMYLECNFYSRALICKVGFFAWQLMFSRFTALRRVKNSASRRRDEKSSSTQFTYDTTVNRFRSQIFSFTRRSRVRNSAFARFIVSVNNLKYCKLFKSTYEIFLIQSR